MDFNRISAYYRVYFEPNSWRNIIYLFIAFPTGLFYFTLLTVALSLASSLLIVGVGLLILIGTGYAILSAAEFERKLANEFLDTEIIPLPAVTREHDGIMDMLRSMMTVSMFQVTIYLFSKFIFGIIALIAALLAVTVPLAAVFFPIMALANPAEIQFGASPTDNNPQAFVVMFAGLLLAPLMMHGANMLTNRWRLFAQTMLGPTAKEAEDAYGMDLRSYKRKNGSPADSEAYIAKPKRAAETPIAAGETPKYVSQQLTDFDDEESKRSLGDLVRRTMEADQAASHDGANS